MPVLSAKKLSKTYGPQTLFTDVTLTIVRGERVGLLGVNGTGKSTLLRILAGLETADTGSIERRRDSTVLYLAQEPALEPDQTPRQIVEQGLAAWKTATEEHDAISKRIESEGASDALVTKQSEVADRIEQLGGWSRGHLALDMLGRLGITDVDRAVGTMSGGERRRVALAQVLVAEPMLAILDEPTNHLDADTIAWLEEYLEGTYRGAVLLVTHDRYVLDSVCDRTLELDRGTLVEYSGGYGDFLEQKAERLAHEDRAEANRLNILRRERAWLLRGAKARSTKQKARIQRAEALIANEGPKAVSTVDLSDLGSNAPKLGGAVVDLEHVDLELGGRSLVRDFTLHLVRGERMGIVGRNGTGKTSLLRVITGELPPTRGSVTLGSKTRIALFDQARAALIDDWSIIDNVAERQGADRSGAGVVIIGDRTLEMRTYLELFLFEGSKQRQPVGSLSGGERARVALAKILRSGANLLLLDEPTNDLDVATLGALEELLDTWPGAAIIVSHDRWFLDRVATSVAAFEGDGKIVQYAGNYSSYRTQRAANLATVEAASKDAKARTKEAASKETVPVSSDLKPLSFSERKELDGLMDGISAAEDRVGALERDLADPELYATQASKVAGVAAALDKAKAEVVRLMERWESLEARRAITKGK